VIAAATLLGETIMEKVRLGRTGLFVTKLGWGGIPIQRAYEDEAILVIKAVVEMGVDLLDTARVYTNSEYRIGMAIQNMNKPVILSSKSNVRTEKIFEDVKISLQQMRVKKIPIYHLHNVSNFEEYDKVMGSGGAYEGLKRARDKGLIDYIGITSHSLDVLARAVGDGYVDVLMACYSFLEPDAARKVFPEARAKDIGIIAMKPFSGGVIEQTGPALRFVLSTPDVVPIPGSETVEKAYENWEIFRNSHSLTEKDQAYIETLRKEMDQQFCRRCDYCQPCSEKISIQLIMGLKSIVKRFGRGADQPDWILNVIEKARNCSDCGDCLPRCPYQLRIPEMIKENLAWYDRLKAMGHQNGVSR
jgi:predicted aldo/keto reductase-like oxidoreductase